MKIVVDSNLVFSAMLNPQSSIGDIILNSQETFSFHGCEYLKEEISEHRSKILKISRYSESEYDELLMLIYSRISFEVESNIPFEIWLKAAELVRDVDMDDIAHVALCLYLDIKLWTGDKNLIQGLTQKGFKYLITTPEMLQIRKLASL